ncbi:DUF7522 family protein [Halogeometricum limi]|uniref:GAF domain-containing protein n=1 Tax=Halogeometricum limi TaxID=555875 RepID=A0A1I6HU45_9EURY|nr:hypothetical protein [Halogeometricum limi]SFR57976.1 hypothetical protein SAMN04488124_2460 [Halogeometricum limi]
MERPSDQLLDVVQEFGGDALRDVWLFDEHTSERVYVRADVAETISEEGLDVERFIDNERYGFVTRRTYESLYYADYGYTVRSLSSFELFRTFLGDEPLGVFVSFDPKEGCYDYNRLNDSIGSLVDELGATAFSISDENPEPV